jgi:hypothetical protein
MAPPCEIDDDLYHESETELNISKIRPLTVNEARPRPRQDRDWEALPRTDGPRTGGFGGGRGGGGWY